MKNTTKLGLAVLFLMTLVSGCTSMKRAQTGIARGIGGTEVIKIGEHEVYCAQGRVCAEIEVLSIDTEDRDGGRVRVVMKNRTGNDALIQVRLEIKSATGEVLVETRPENFALPKIQEKTYEMRGIFRKGANLRVILSTAS